MASGASIGTDCVWHYDHVFPDCWRNPMLRSVTSLGVNGVQNYLLIRSTMVIMVLYSCYLIGFWLVVGEVTYSVWRLFFSSTLTKVFTMLALVSMLIHGWIGMWQVLTDYVVSPWLRAWLQFAIVVLLVGYLFGGLFILWGV